MTALERHVAREVCVHTDKTSDKTSAHLFFVCRKAKRRSPRPPGSPSLALPYLLGTPKGAIELADWLSKTSFFKDICPRPVCPKV